MSDLISRQAAIDALNGEIEITGRTNAEAIKGYVRLVKDRLERLPSAQPEIIRCKDCKYGVDYYHDGSCYCAKPGYELLYFDGSWEFYCANAERREVTE